MVLTPEAETTTTKRRKPFQAVAELVVCALMVIGFVYVMRSDPWFLGFLAAIIALSMLMVRFPDAADVVGRTFTAIVVYYFLFLGLMMLAFGPAVGALSLARFVIARSSLWLQVALLVVWAGLLATLISFLATDRRRTQLFERLGRIGAVAPAAYAFNVLMVAVMFFGALTRVLMARNALSLKGDPERVFDFYIWHFFESIPLLAVNQTLRWDQPLTYDASGVGWILLAFKLVVIVPVIAAFGAYWKHVTGGPASRPAEQEPRT